VEFLRKACTYSLVPALLSNEVGTVECANAGACAAFGYAPNELVGHPLRRLIAPQSLDAFKAAVAEYTNQGALQLQLMLIKRDGGEFYAELSSVRIPHDSGDGATFWTTIRDLSQQRALEQSEAAFRTLAHATSEAIVLHRSGTIVLTNDTAVRIHTANGEGQSASGV